MNFGTIKSTFWNPFGVYWMASKSIWSQILGWGFKSKQVPKRCSPVAADISLHFWGCNFQTAGNLKLQEALMETRLLELSPRFGVNPFRQVFWKLCSLEVGAANLKSTGSFLLLLLYLLLFGPPSPFPFGRLFGLVFHGFLVNVKAYKCGENLSM